MKQKLKRSANGRPIGAEDLRLANLIRSRSDNGLSTHYDAIRVAVNDGPDREHWTSRLVTGLYRLADANYISQRFPAGTWHPTQTWRDVLSPPVLPTADVAAVAS